MTGTRRTCASVAAAVAGLGVLLWASTAGSAHLAKRAPTYFHPHGAVDHARPQLQSGGGGGSPGRPALVGVDLSWLQPLLVWSGVLVLCAVGLALGWWLWSRRPRFERRPPRRVAERDLEVLPDVDRLREALAGTSDTLRSLLADGSPREGVIRCWLRLEQLVADLGVNRAPAETSTELTVRLLHALDLDPRPVGALAAMYREARFSSHDLDESARTTARALLDQVQRELLTGAGAR